MRFNIFSSREPATVQPDSSEPGFDHDTERECLTVALYSLLETLPQSYSGRENIKLFCHAIISATPHLRFVWVGFCEGRLDVVPPYASAGDCGSECHDWELPKKAFDPVGPYSQCFPRDVESANDLNPLFGPWRDGWSSPSVDCALAIPLRSEKRGLRGLVVFYADSKEYFQYLGVSLFQAFCHVAEIIWKQSNLMHMLTQRAQQDPLTGLMNRRHAMQVLEKSMATATVSDVPLSILLCCLEGFSKLNEVYGWLASDAILAAFCHEMSAQMRPQDKGGRWTDVEFLFVLNETGPEEAETLARGLREYFLLHSIQVKSWSIRLSLTVGVATWSKSIVGLDDFILHANQNALGGADELPSTIF